MVDQHKILEDYIEYLKKKYPKYIEFFNTSFKEKELYIDIDNSTSVSKKFIKELSNIKREYGE